VSEAAARRGLRPGRSGRSGACRLGAWLLAVAALCAAAPAGAAPREASVPLRSGPVTVATIRGTINPASADYLMKAIDQSEREGASLLVIELDTPGGLVASTKDIIQAILNARVPVAVFVSPQGAWAGSAGTYITLAAHVAAMAPGSSIGAAHPVGVGGGSPGGEEGKGKDVAAQKAENLLAAFIESIAKERGRNVEWAEKAVRESVAVTAEEALHLHVIDLVATDRADLLRQIDGREVALPGGRVRLAVAGARQIEIPMSLMTRLLNVLVDPNVAVILLLAGALGLYVEFNQPGVLLPGIVGGICLILALVAMQVLPFSWVGLLLLASGLALLVAEVFVSSFGLLFAAGLICLLLGGSMLFDRPEVSDLDVDFWSVLLPTVLGLGLFGGLVVYAVGRSLGRPQTAGVGELLGLVGTALTPLAPEGTVFVRGEYWRARSSEPVAERERVEVLGVRGLELTVRRAPPES
jgi:membrane-bound serine protease (ClpP class)